MFSVPAQSNMTIKVLMRANVTEWNFKNTTTPQVIPYKDYTDEQDLKRKIIHDICEKCGAFSPAVPQRNQFFAAFKLNLSASVLGTQFDLSHDGILSLTCVRNPYIPMDGTTYTITRTTTTTSSTTSTTSVRFVCVCVRVCVCVLPCVPLISLPLYVWWW